MTLDLKAEKKLKRQGYRFVIGLDEAGRGCERPDAEILTNNGWKFYSDINLKDKALSYAHDGYMEWQKIEKVIEKDFKGDLIELKNRGIDIVVTPEHYFTIIRRVFKRDKKDNNKLKLIGYKTRRHRKMVVDLSDNDFIPRGGKWRGKNTEFFKLPKVGKNREKLIDIKLWVAFLGIFLAEGSTSYYEKKGMYRIAISQSRKTLLKKYQKIYCLLEELPFKFNETSIGFTCCNKQLYSYLKQFGKCYHKFIPKDVKELSPPLLNILINWMILGDGSCYAGKNRKKVCEYYTVSEKLKDDFEEILLKAGWTYHTSVRVPKDTYIGGRLIKKENKVPCFEIRLRRNNKAIVKHLHKKEVFYKGKVFCLQLPKHHNFYVRRNGTGYFTGNSLAGPVVAAAVLLKNPKSDRARHRLAKSRWAGIRKLLKQIRDSKKLTPRKREELYQVLRRCPQIQWGRGLVSARIIDRVNILEATKLAMRRAVKNLERKLGRKFPKKGTILIMDGNQGIKSEFLEMPIVRADEKIFLCACASIAAKVERDNLMRKYHKIYPQYNFAQHKGYPTKEHYKRIKKHGLSPLHRRTFRCY